MPGLALPPALAKDLRRTRPGGGLRLPVQYARSGWDGGLAAMRSDTVYSKFKCARVPVITLVLVIAAVHLSRERRWPQRRTRTANTLAVNPGQEPSITSQLGRSRARRALRPASGSEGVAPRQGALSHRDRSSIPFAVRNEARPHQEWWSLASNPQPR